MRLIIAFALPALALIAAPSSSDAQDSLAACESQREIEQVLQSGGDLMPTAAAT